MTTTFWNNDSTSTANNLSNNLQQQTSAVINGTSNVNPFRAVGGTAIQQQQQQDSNGFNKMNTFYVNFQNSTNDFSQPLNVNGGTNAWSPNPFKVLFF